MQVALPQRETQGANLHELEHETTRDVNVTVLSPSLLLSAREP